MLKRALQIVERAYGPEHSRVVASLDNLATALYAQEKFAEAEPIYQRTLAIRKKTLGERHEQKRGAAAVQAAQGNRFR